MSQTPPDRSATDERDATQNAILDAVLACFEKYGLAATTTRRIAQEAGVNEVTLFRRFGNKEELIRQLLEREIQSVSFGFGYTGNLKTDLIQIVETYIRGIGQKAALFTLMFAEMPRHPELKVTLEAPLRMFAEVAGVLQRYQDEGKLRPEPVGDTASALLGPLLLPGLLRGFNPMLNMPEPHKHVVNFLEGRATTRRT